MRWQTIGGIVGVVILLGVVGFLLWLPGSAAPEELASPMPSLTISNWGRAGEYGYLTYSSTGHGEAVLVSLNETPQTRVSILSEPDAIGIQQFDAFVDGFSALYAYGYDVNVVGRLSDVQEGIYVVPAGAMPAYALRSLDAPNVTMLYVGHKDLIIQNGIKNQNWYDSLNDEQRQRLIIYESTLDESYENNRSFLLEDILEQRWAQVDRKTWALSPGNGTLVVFLGNATHLRLFYSFSTTFAQNTTLYDSPVLLPTARINATPDSVFPGEKGEIAFALNDATGDVFFQAEHDGVLTYQERLGRITEPQLFFLRPQFTEPGEYILRVVDSVGERATGWLHVKELNVRLQEVRGNKYVFNVTLDGAPMESGRILARLNHSNIQREYFIQDGSVTIPTRLQPGENIFVIQWMQQVYYIPVQHEQQGLVDAYIRYGIPGLIMVALVFALARMARRPTYKIRFGDVGREIRKDVKLTPTKALALFQKIPLEQGITGPITAKEFARALKQHVTEDAEVTEGNVEAILKTLMDRGEVESYRGYYQLRNKGDVRKNVLRRMVRETLIENGISFTIRGNVIITRDFEVGFFGDRFKKKAYLLIEDMQEKEDIHKRLPEKENAIMILQEQTGKIEFITIDTLKQIL